jgi:hypothetical protein
VSIIQRVRGLEVRVQGVQGAAGAGEEGEMTSKMSRSQILALLYIQPPSLR